MIESDNDKKTGKIQSFFDIPAFHSTLSYADSDIRNTNPWLRNYSFNLRYLSRTATLRKDDVQNWVMVSIHAVSRGQRPAGPVDRHRLIKRFNPRCLSRTATAYKQCVKRLYEVSIHAVSRGQRPAFAKKGNALYGFNPRCLSRTATSNLHYYSLYHPHYTTQSAYFQTRFLILRRFSAVIQTHFSQKSGANPPAFSCALGLRTCSNLSSK